MSPPNLGPLLCKIGCQFWAKFRKIADEFLGNFSDIFCAKLGASFGVSFSKTGIPFSAQFPKSGGGSFGPAKLSPISGAAIKNLIRNDFAWPVLGPQKGPIFGHQKLGPGLIFGHFLGAFWDMKTGQFLDAKVGSFGSRFWIHFGNSRFWFCAHL